MSNIFLPVIARKKVGGGGTWTANNAILSAQDAALTLYHKFNDRTDSIGSNDCTDGGATFTAGKRDDAATVSGTQYLEVPYSLAFNPEAGNFAHFFWMKRDNASGNAIIFGPAPGGVFPNSWAWFEDSDNFLFLASTNGTSWTVNKTVGSIPNNTWAQWGWIRVGDAWRFYKNGALGESDTHAGTVHNNGYLLQMFTQRVAARYMAGQYDENAMWKAHTLADTAAADAFAAAHYNATVGAFLI